ncbi:MULTISPECIES: hypothetical protein [Streptomyces]|uniref:hypothetical protein n=1 Tax=Streptomyces TaxID=1883 RepID=UPI000A5C7881|nr:MULTISPECIES: hypothetical protein [Streptomyces]
MTTDEQLDASLGELKRAVRTLEATVKAIEKRMNLMYTAALLVVGAVGGPNAVQAIVGH